MNLRIHSIESFGTVDGPGVRFVIFTQGCPLRCKYCHNPDTWNRLGGYDISIDELLRQIDDVSVFIKNGGVTVTGGEALLQAKAISVLFKALKDRQIHTCIDTSGFAPITEDVKEMLKYTDLVLLDIKVLDDEKHKYLTGVSNKTILEFARYLDENDIPIWIRHVVLPSFNDTKEDLEQLKKYVESIKNLVKVEVLPYHELGIMKWQKLKMNYELGHIKPPSKQRINEIKEYLRSNLNERLN